MATRREATIDQVDAPRKHCSTRSFVNLFGSPAVLRIEYAAVADRNAPIAFARRLARELPDATLHVTGSSGARCGPRPPRRDHVRAWFSPEVARALRPGYNPGTPLLMRRSTGVRR